MSEKFKKQAHILIKKLGKVNSQEPLWKITLISNEENNKQPNGYIKPADESGK